MIGTFLGSLAAVVLAASPAQASKITVLNSLPSARVVQRPAAPIKRRSESLGVKTTSRTAFVADVSTGSVLYAKDPHRVMPIASLTKLVTAMVLLDQQPDLQTPVTILAEDFDQENVPDYPSGETFTLHDVLRSMLIGSVNASANAIARITGGEERFAELMNEKMEKMRLRSAVFVEPSGIDPRNRANAADVAAILSTASSYSAIREMTGYPRVTIRGLRSGKEYGIKSTNLLLDTYLNKKPFQIVAAKTGSLPEAGYCMAQVTRNADGHEIVVVELGSDNHFSRYQDIKALTTWAFDTYEWK